MEIRNSLSLTSKDSIVHLSSLNGTIAGDYIDGVTFDEIENLGTGSQGGPAYNNYTSFSANLERGRTYELTIQAETSGANGSIAAWIDFNGNQ